MDFWDITKLLVRRWMVMVPLLLVSVALGVLAMTKVQPDYDATAHVQLVPPVVGASTPGQATADQRNPWIGLGLQTIGNAGIVTITDLSVTDELHREGLSDSYTVVMTEGSPLINFEIVGNSPEQATATTDELISRFDKTITSLQTSYGVPQSDLITTHRLDVGNNVKKSTSKIKRAAIGVVGACVLLTVAITVGADAWLKRRPRRRTGAVGAGAGADLGTQPSGTRASATTGRANGGHGPQLAGVATARPVSPAPAGVTREGDGGSDFEVGLTQPISVPIIMAHDPERESEPVLATPSDATIVLPSVGQKPWPGRRRERT